MKKQRVMGILSLILGIFLLFAGIYALSHLRTTFAGMTVFYGVLAVFTGIVDIVFYARMDRSTGFGPGYRAGFRRFQHCRRGYAAVPSLGGRHIPDDSIPNLVYRPLRFRAGEVALHPL